MFERLREYRDAIAELRSSLRGIEIIGPAKKTDETPVAAPDPGLIHFAWIIHERPRRSRSITWYIVAIAALGGLAIYGIIAQNFLLAILSILVAAIYIIQQQRGELQLEFKITERGIWRGPYLYPYREFKQFWLYYDPPIKTLYLDFRNALKPRLSIPLADQNPVKVRDTLALYLPEDVQREEEAISDKLERGLKL